MAIRTVVTRGYGNGTFNGTIALLITRGYAISAAATPAPVQLGNINLDAKVAGVLTLDARVAGTLVLDAKVAGTLTLDATPP